jgi:hypothetical protein
MVRTANRFERFDLQLELWFGSLKLHQEKISGLPWLIEKHCDRRFTCEAEVSASYQPPFWPFLLIACTHRIITAES